MSAGADIVTVTGQGVPWAANEELATLLQTYCEASKADYAVFWRLGNCGLEWGGGYISIERQSWLASLGKTSTYANDCKGLVFRLGGSSLVSMAFTSGERIFVKDVASSDRLAQARKDKAAQYGIVALCFVSALGGVIEYGTGKLGAEARRLLRASVYTDGEARVSSAEPKTEESAGSANSAADLGLQVSSATVRKEVWRSESLTRLRSMHSSSSLTSLAGSASAPQSQYNAARALKKELSLLKVAFREFEDDARALLKAQGPAEGRLDVTIAKAEHLPRMDTFGRCDGFVQVEYAQQRHKTQVIRNSFSPVWNQEFVIQVQEVQTASPLTLSLLDWNSNGEAELAGDATISAEQLAALFAGVVGASTTLQVLLLSPDRHPVVGNDKQLCHVTVHIRPWLRYMQSPAYQKWKELKAQQGLLPGAADDHERLVSEISWCGVVMKRGHVNKAYQRRYLLLDNGMLQYYRVEDLPEEAFGYNVSGAQARGQLSCYGCAAMVAQGDGEQDCDSGKRFTVTDASGWELECKCCDADAAKTWVDKINAASAAAASAACHSAHAHPVSRSSSAANCSHLDDVVLLVHAAEDAGVTAAKNAGTDAGSQHADRLSCAPQPAKQISSRTQDALQGSDLRQACLHDMVSSTCFVHAELWTARPMRNSPLAHLGSHLLEYSGQHSTKPCFAALAAHASQQAGSSAPQEYAPTDAPDARDAADLGEPAPHAPHAQPGRHVQYPPSHSPYNLAYYARQEVAVAGSLARLHARNGEEARPVNQAAKPARSEPAGTPGLPASPWLKREGTAMSPPPSAHLHSTPRTEFFDAQATLGGIHGNCLEVAAYQRTQELVAMDLSAFASSPPSSLPAARYLGHEQQQGKGHAARQGAHEAGSTASESAAVLRASLFQSCLAVPLASSDLESQASMAWGTESSSFSKASTAQEEGGVLLLFTPHTADAIPQSYFERGENTELYELLNASLQVMALSAALHHGQPSFDAALSAHRRVVQARVRKMWFKLRICVRCGWVKGGKDDAASATLAFLGPASLAFQRYIRKFRGAGVAAPPRADLSTIAVTFAGSLLGLGSVSLLHFRVFLPARADGWEYSIMSGSFGALACLLYAMPMAPFSQPRMVIGGHILALTIAVTMDYFGNSRFVSGVIPMWVMAALTPALAISAMAVSGCINPPAAAASLIYASDALAPAPAGVEGGNAKATGWMFLFFPNLVGCVIMILVAILVNNTSSKRKYPQFWY